MLFPSLPYNPCYNWHKIKQHLINSLFPSICLVCGEKGQPTLNLCQACQPLLCSALPIPSCQQCAKPLSGALLCGQCLTHPPPFDQIYALSDYTQPMIHLIHGLKFRQELIQATMLGNLLAEVVSTRWYRTQQLPDILIPVPLHPSRLKERGFNQSLEIARPLSRVLHIPIDCQGIKRIKATATQSSLSATQRRCNLISAFQTNKDYTGKHLAIIDDVVTTGSTVTACATSLKQAQATHIDIWCLARSASA